MYSASDVTLCIPAHQQSPVLDRVIESVLTLTPKPARIFVIDDGAWPPIRHDQVNILQHPANMGLAKARNSALEACGTKLIAYIDSDVVLSTDWLNQLLDSMNKTRASGAGGKVVESCTQGIGNAWRCRHMKQDWGEDPVVNPRFLYGANSIYCADDLKEAGGFDDRYRTHDEDRDIGQRLREAGKQLVYNPKAMCFHKKENNWRDILHDYWRWHYTPGLIAGDYDSPDGLLRRIEIVDFGISRYRLHLDKGEAYRRFRLLDALIPFVFFYNY